MNRRERGDSLILILALLLTVSLLTVTGPLLRERVAADQQRMIETHMAADAGITAAVRWLDTAGDDYWDGRADREWQAIAAIHARHDNRFGRDARWRIVSLDFHHPQSDTVTIRSRGSLADATGGRDIIVRYQRPTAVSLSSARGVYGWRVAEN